MFPCSLQVHLPPSCTLSCTLPCTPFLSPTTLPPALIDNATPPPPQNPTHHHLPKDMGGVSCHISPGTGRPSCHSPYYYTYPPAYPVLTPPSIFRLVCLGPFLEMISCLHAAMQLPLRLTLIVMLADWYHLHMCRSRTPLSCLRIHLYPILNSHCSPTGRDDSSVSLIARDG